MSYCPYCIPGTTYCFGRNLYDATFFFCRTACRIIMRA